MLHANNDDTNAAHRQAYADHQHELLHAGIGAPPGLMQRPHNPIETGFQNINGYYHVVPSFSYANTDDFAAIAAYYNADSGSLQQQPSFIRRPFRYQKRGAKRRTFSRPPVSPPRLGRVQDGDEYQWDTYVSHQQPLIDMSTIKGDAYDCNQYTSLYQDSYPPPAMDFYAAPDVNAIQPKVLSPPMEPSGKMLEDNSSDEHGEACASKSGFLPSPNSNCTSPDPAPEPAKKRGRKSSTRTRGVVKPRARRSLKRGVQKDSNRIAPKGTAPVAPPKEIEPDFASDVNLNAEEKRALDDMFQRQFDTMCRAVINEFNAHHTTQIGADLILHILQSKDLISPKTDEEATQ